MKRLTSIWIVVISCFLFSSFEEKSKPYAENPDVCDAKGKPKDSLTFYFPSGNNQDSEFAHTRSGYFELNWYSSNLYSFKEPILYNYYLGKDIYRFLWLRSFHRPVVISLFRAGDQITLATKMLDQQPEFMDMKYGTAGWTDSAEIMKGKTIVRYGDSVVLVKADRKADIVYSETKSVTLKEWNDFNRLLQTAKFWSTPAFFKEMERGTDGSEWLMEGHLKDRYRFVLRWSPSGTYREAGLYLIRLSGLNEKIY